ncbi:nuclear transport factor 2 family protein [uncultured Polaribacter sp.]|uniref:nuclear transport factor 2 family protein n=1 Tax=uncultured Polaribacter sp. TaxID=174711 RepID=UPI002610441B|nr:nuclear transport factor 2 family protein [uncultured Polaribacter sp.]
MKKLLILILFTTLVFNAQVNTEVYVFDIVETAHKTTLQNEKNISNNLGYDSQPYFYDATTVIFSSARNGKTDIALYDLKMNRPGLNYISETKNGGEYSPKRIPNSNDISAVRLDNDGLQRFYSYNFKTKESTALIANLKVAYPTWVDKNTVIAVAIVQDSLELFISDLKKKTNTSVAKMVGRSVHKIPNSNLVSFISKENEKYWLLKSLHPVTKEIKTITSVGTSEDVAWLPNGTLLLSRGNKIDQFNPQKDKKPSLFYSFSDGNINNISRMAIDKTGTKIALVAEISPKYLAQEQLEGYNQRDIDAFLKPYAKDVKVYNFPNELRYEGLETMRKRYEGFFKNTQDLHCELTNRIVFKNTVIDHELVTANGRQFKAVAIYKIKNGKISSVTFM